MDLLGGTETQLSFDDVLQVFSSIERLDWISAKVFSEKIVLFLHSELTLGDASVETVMSACIGESLFSTTERLFDIDVSWDKIAAYAWLLETDE